MKRINNKPPKRIAPSPPPCRPGESQDPVFSFISDGLEQSNISLMRMILVR